MNKTEKMALQCGVKVRAPQIQTSYFPIKFSDYIVLDSRFKVPSAAYDYYDEVISSILPFLSQNKIEVVHFTQEGQPSLDGVHNYIGLSKKQESYLVKGAKLVISNDNAAGYLAAIFGVKSITLHSIYYADNVKPLWNPQFQIHLESHRLGNKPSYGLNEDPKTINFIKPEQVAAKILDCLSIKHDLLDIDTIHTGKFYAQKITSIVPDFITDPSFLAGCAVNINVDYLSGPINYEVIGFWASGRKLNILTNRDLDIEFLKRIKQSIVSITVICSDQISEQFLKSIRDIGISFIIYCYDKDRLSQYRFSFFDFNVIEMNKMKKENLWENEKITSGCFYKSNKIILSKGKKFPSLAAYKLNKPLDNTELPVILSEEFFEEAEYFRIYAKS